MADHFSFSIINYRSMTVMYRAVVAGLFFRSKAVFLRGGTRENDFFFLFFGKYKFVSVTFSERIGVAGYIFSPEWHERIA